MKKKWAILNSQNKKYRLGSGIVRKQLTSTVIRFADNFLVIINDESQINYICNKIEIFLNNRGLTVNEKKMQKFLWKNNSKFDFLGFTFHNLTKPKIGKITEQRDSKNQRKIRGGLYVYPSNTSVRQFRKKIKSLFVKNLNLTPYKLILLLNPIIRYWGNYFGSWYQTNL